MDTQLDLAGSKEYIEGLTEEQLKVFHDCYTYVTNDDTEERYLLIEGYAGTGKTHVISRFISYLKSVKKTHTVAMTAPTNKAVKVLLSSYGKNNTSVAFETIHRLLGLKPKIEDNGDQKFVADLFSDRRIDGYKLVIIDEVSMLPDEIFHEINKIDKIKIIFLGDPCQVPPVNNSDSIPMRSILRDEYKIKCTRLTKIMRQAEGNPIIGASFKVRENISKNILSNWFKTDINENIGVICYNMNDMDHKIELVEQITKMFNSNQFKSDSNYVKVIGYRNATVDKFNKNIREKIYGKGCPKVVIGEKLIADSPIIENKHMMKKIIFNTNDEFEVVDYKIDTFHELKCYVCVVDYYDIDKDKIDSKTIRIIHEDNEPMYRNKLREIQEKAKSSYKKNPSLSKQMWQYFYGVKEWFADVNYNYAITTHKAQGSSYLNTIVLMNDIMESKKLIERNRILYTAFTRPRKKLIIVS